MQNIKVDDILVSSYGYNCTLVEYYRVKRVTNCSVWLQKLETKHSYNDDEYGQSGKVIPGKETLDKPIMRRISRDNYSNTFYVAINKYKYAYQWDGNPTYYNSMD